MMCHRVVMSGVVIAMVLAACGPRSTERRKDQVLINVAERDFAAAQEGLDALYNSNPHGDGRRQDQHGIVWAMERGTVAFIRQRYVEAERFLRMAAEQAEEHRARVMSREIGSALINETLLPYDGAPHENVFVQYLRGLGFLQQAQMSAGVWMPPGDGDALQTQAVDPEFDTLGLYENAANVLRGASESLLTWVADHAGRDRYRDDPWVRLMAAAAIAAKPRTSDLEWQGAAMQALRAAEAYREQRRRLHGDPLFGYHVSQRPDLLTTLGYRVTQRYQREVHARFVEAVGRPQRGDLPEGHGSVLVINHRGTAARKHVLDINLIAVSNANAAETRRRNPQAVSYGGFIMWASGPGWARVKNTLIGFPVPEGLADLLAPGGLSILGVALPVHAPQARPAAPPRVRFIPEQGSPGEMAMEVVSDVDAYARATLKDGQARLFGRALGRIVAKNLPTVLIAREQRRQGDAGGAALTGLVGSLAARVTEIADTRCWTTLPGLVDAALLDLPAGRYRLQVQEADGTIIEAGSVQLAPGALVVVPVHHPRHVLSNILQDR